MNIRTIFAAAAIIASFNVQAMTDSECRDTYTQAYAACLENGGLEHGDYYQGLSSAAHSWFKLLTKDQQNRFAIACEMGERGYNNFSALVCK